MLVDVGRHPGRLSIPHMHGALRSLHGRSDPRFPILVQASRKSRSKTFPMTRRAKQATKPSANAESFELVLSNDKVLVTSETAFLSRTWLPASQIASARTADRMN